MLTGMQDILEYLLHLQASGLALSSWKVHLAAISAHAGHIGIFELYGSKLLERSPLFPPTYSFVGSQFGFAALVRPSFEPLVATFPLLCQKTAFLVAITSAGRVWEFHLWWQSLLINSFYIFYLKWCLNFTCFVLSHIQTWRRNIFIPWKIAAVKPCCTSPCLFVICSPDEGTSNLFGGDL